jgi:hypothetical protein
VVVAEGATGTEAELTVAEGAMGVGAEGVVVEGAGEEATGGAEVGRETMAEATTGATAV